MNEVKKEGKKEVAPEVTKPLTEEEVKKNAQEEDRKTMRVIQIIQHVEGQKIEVIPIQNLDFRSDGIGVLLQAIENYTITDITQNNVMLLRETVGMIGNKLDNLLGNKEKASVKLPVDEAKKSKETPE